METNGPVPADILNKNSLYLESLRKQGIQMTELRAQDSPFNAVVFNNEQLVNTIGLESKSSEMVVQQPKSNMLMLYAVQGEAGLAQIGGSFAIELKSKVNNVVNLNAPISPTALESAVYNADLQKQARQMAELYIHAIPESQRHQPIKIVGHSMGGTSAPLVAKELISMGYNVSDIVMIAPPGMVERSGVQMLNDFTKLGSKENLRPDVPNIYPSPADIASFKERYKELSEKKKLTSEEREEKAMYELAISRQVDPDKLTLSNMTRAERDAVIKIDVEMLSLLEATDDISQKRLKKLQEQRFNILKNNTWKVIPGKVNNQPSQRSLAGGEKLYLTGNLVRSLGGFKRTVTDLASEITVGNTQDLIDFNNTLPDHKLRITLIAGKDDPIAGQYEVGHVKHIKVGPNTSYGEIQMPEFSHYSLSVDPVRVAQAVGRIIEAA